MFFEERRVGVVGGVGEVIEDTGVVVMVGLLVRDRCICVFEY